MRVWARERYCGGTLNAVRIDVTRLPGGMQQYALSIRTFDVASSCGEQREYLCCKSTNTKMCSKMACLQLLELTHCRCNIQNLLIGDLKGLNCGGAAKLRRALVGAGISASKLCLVGFGAVKLRGLKMRLSRAYVLDRRRLATRGRRRGPGNALIDPLKSFSGLDFGTCNGPRPWYAILRTCEHLSGRSVVRSGKPC